MSAGKGPFEIYFIVMGAIVGALWLVRRAF
jgi:hypothetical protein